ncbi:hypothetical protein [Synechocystis sp. FACHB-383]|uniref:hypothetical protein n=1 Tax=Synechocystis sp. FACHB-383 TaxID=2692864 RepID=UPI001686F91A|nr:hypothetical protein [Synechocystis sp. FACHB-383]
MAWLSQKDLIQVKTAIIVSLDMGKAQKSLLYTIIQDLGTWGIKFASIKNLHPEF